MENQPITPQNQTDPPAQAPPPPPAPAPPQPQQAQPQQPVQGEPPKQFTSKDLNSIFTPLTPKNALNPLAGTFNPTKLTPDQVEAVASEWHNSKIVKFGGGFLYLVWAAVTIAMLKIVGLVSLVVVTVGIFVSYRIYKKTKSPIAWYSLIALLVIVVAYMTIATRMRN